MNSMTRASCPDHGNFEFLQFNGYYRHGHQIILDYEIHATPILEKVVMAGEKIRRILQVGWPPRRISRTRLSSKPLFPNSMPE